MAGGFPVGAQWAPIQVNTLASSGGVILTSSASNNTVGSYSELVSSTTRGSTWMAVNLRDTSTGTGVTVSAVNFATGASGSEVVAISDLVVSRATSSAQEGGGSNFLIPFSIPSGTRIAANVQSTGISVPVRCSLMLFDDAFGSVRGGASIDTYGFSSGSTIGVQIDPGTTANTKGAWTEITSSLTYDIAGFFAVIDGGGTTPSSLVINFDLDIGVGSSGSEVAILPDWQFVMTCTSSGHRDINPATIPFLPISIPAGTRIAARAAANTTVANSSRIFGLTLYGVRA